MGLRHPYFVPGALDLVHIDGDEGESSAKAGEEPTGPAAELVEAGRSPASTSGQTDQLQPEVLPQPSQT